MTPDLKVFLDLWRTWIINRYSWFCHSILQDFKRQVLRMARAIYREWLWYAICNVEPTIRYYLLDLVFHDFAFFKHYFWCKSRLLNFQAYFRDFKKQNFYIHDQWSSIFSICELCRRLPLYDPLKLHLFCKMQAACSSTNSAHCTGKPELYLYWSSLLLIIVAVYEQDSETSIIADKMTRLLSEAEPPLKATQDQEVTTKMPCVAFRQLNVYFKHLF